MKSLFSQRSYLRRLSKANRRSWFEQRKRLTPRVPIGTLHGVTRHYAYVELQ